MALNFGLNLLAIPGPSIMPERVLSAMHRASPNIYEGDLIDLTDTIYPDLKKVARTSGNLAIYISNGHGAWEATLRNMVIEGDKILVLSTGRFAANWAEMAVSMGIEVQVIDFGMYSDADPERLRQALENDKRHEIRAVLTVQTDTATSVLNDIPALRQAIDDAGHPALFAVDCIASLGCDRFEMDEWGVDVTVSACQKGLMTPAGISFVYANEKALDASKRTKPGDYLNWNNRFFPELFYQRFCGTAPTQHLFGLREALDMIIYEEGIEAVWSRHKTIAKAYWAAVESWSLGGALSPNIKDENKRSSAVTTVETGDGEAAALRAWTEKKAGVTLGIGLGFGTPGSEEFNKRFRIGHMGHQNIPMVLGILGSIDSGLKSLGISHGPGALEAASKVLSSHFDC